MGGLGVGRGDSRGVDLCFIDSWDQGRRLTRGRTVRHEHCFCSVFTIKSPHRPPPRPRRCAVSSSRVAAYPLPIAPTDLDAYGHHKLTPCHQTPCHRMTGQCSPPQESLNTGVWIRILRCPTACIVRSSHATSCRNHLQGRLVKVALSVGGYCVMWSFWLNSPFKSN